MSGKILATLVYSVSVAVFMIAAHESGPFDGYGALAFVVITFGLGFFVQRWWVLIAVMGPTIGLAYLEISGYVGSGEEWSDKPLLSPPGIAGLIWIGLLIALGIGFARIETRVQRAWERRSG